MIKSFSDKSTEFLYINGKCQDFPPSIISVSLRKLDYLNAATSLDDLRVPPGNRLELLKGSLNNFYSIRINDQYRIIFNFIEGNAYDVKICDYH